jgi:putative intracellular protease/amidase
MSAPGTRPVRLPSIERLMAATSPAGARPFRVGILIGPGFIPMDMMGVQTVFGLLPGCEIHLVWKSREPVEGLPSWWTLPTTTFADCPPELDVFSVPMLPPEVTSDPEVVAFVGAQARKARYVIGICNGVVLLGAAGVLQGKRATTSYNSLGILPELGVTEVVSDGSGVVVDGNLYTAGPGNGSVEAALLVAEAAFGRPVAEFVELVIEYDPHPPFGTGAARRASADQVARFEGLMSDMINSYRDAAVSAFTTAGYRDSR